MTNSKSEIFERVLQGERQRNVNCLNWVRFAGVSLVLALELVVNHLTVNKVIPVGTFMLEWNSTLGATWEHQMVVPVAETAVDFAVHQPPPDGGTCF